MRPVLLNDLTVAARALLKVPARARSELCAQMIKEAEFADRFTRRLNKQHPQWGNGTLLFAASQRALGAERACNDAEYNSCLLMVLQAISNRHNNGFV